MEKLLPNSYLIKNETAIKNFAYNLYCFHWLKDHLTFDQFVNTYKDYIESLTDTNPTYEFLDYINDFGFDGECYACLDEFLENEYQDKEYMKQLLDNPNYYELYEKDINK